MAARVTTVGRRVVIALIRGWTRIYTFRVPAPIGQQRRDGIESDLWESQHDPDGGAFAGARQLAIRLVLGMPSDVVWRVETVQWRWAVTPRTVALACALAVVVTMWWVSGPAPRVVHAPSVRLIDPMLVLAPPPTASPAPSNR
jgi:hypothetical protein